MLLHCHTQPNHHWDDTFHRHLLTIELYHLFNVDPLLLDTLQSSPLFPMDQEDLQWCKYMSHG
jgi:hypothetical protein